MRLRARGRDVHLGYCSNIHAGESWAETLHNLRDGVCEVKAKVCPSEPFGVGLRLSARAASELASQAGELERLRDELAARGLYVFTINGFPHGTFHGTRVKEQVYQPDWCDPERVRYTLELARILAALLPAGVRGSISTVPLGFRPHFSAREPIAAAVEQLLRCAAELVRLRDRAGAEIALALEPEPACALETSMEAVAFFQRELWSDAALARFGALSGRMGGQAEELLRSTVGLCLDTCHAAVEFEQPRETVRALAAAGVALCKVQATTGLVLDPSDANARAAITRFDDPVYLHQVVAHTELGLERYLDLGEALAGHHPQQREWRVHYHVPVFERALSPLENTQPFLCEALDEVIAGGLCDHVEVETYTWSVLPAQHRALPLAEMIARELGFTRGLIERGQA